MREVPQMLPPDVSHFTDRVAELLALDALLPTEGSLPPAAVVISAIAGTAGMGKTSLAVRWAHRMRHRFPDGQLYVNLRGYDPSPRVRPEQALDGFLRVLDVSGESIPREVDAMAGLYRSLLADRRMFVLLDNAATPDQVRPLLPASPTCMVLITSRSSMSGLVARDGGRRITLDLLPVDEAITLLRKIIGASRTDAEPEAVAELARCCAYLPLALRIAAERVLTHSHRRIADLVADLMREQDRLDVLAIDDDETSTVRSVFSWSYLALSAESARLFRLLGLHPGPTISSPAAAALADTTPTAARRLLDGLASAHLLDEVGPDRYTFHDLLRAYAADRADAEEPGLERANAAGRMFDWYLHTAHAAALVLWPQQPAKPIGPPPSGCHPQTFASYDEALRWSDAELDNLLAAVHHAAGTGWPTIAWQLPLAMGDALFLRSRWADLITVHQIGLAAARSLDDQRAEYWALSWLAVPYVHLERFDEVISCAERATEIARDGGQKRDEGGAHHDIGVALHHLGRFDDAIVSLRRALAIYREVGDRRGEGIVLSLVGEILRKQRRYDEALDQAGQGLMIIQMISNRWEEALALHRIGLIHVDTRRLDDAIEILEQARAIYGDLDIRYESAKVVQDLGLAHREAGRLDEARQYLRDALATFDSLNSPKAAEVRSHLDALG